MSATAPSPNLEVLLDVPVKLTVELGSCLMPMREILQLAPGSVVQLDKLADTPVDIFVNCQVVVVEDMFGIKLTELVGKAA
jgi:flagellar motor switch protein FliN/FliY